MIKKEYIKMKYLKADKAKYTTITFRNSVTMSKYIRFYLVRELQNEIYKNCHIGKLKSTLIDEIKEMVNKVIFTPEQDIQLLDVLKNRKNKYIAENLPMLDSLDNKLGLYRYGK